MKKILGGKEQVCDICGSSMEFVFVDGFGVISQCKCGNTVKGKMTDEVNIYTYNPVLDTGKCKVKLNKMHDLKKLTHISNVNAILNYKVIAANIVEVDNIFITKQQLEDYFEIC